MPIKHNPDTHHAELIFNGTQTVRYHTTREHAPGKTLTVPCGCVYAWVCADSSGRIHELVLYVQWSVYKIVYVHVYVYPGVCKCALCMCMCM